MLLFDGKWERLGRHFIVMEVDLTSGLCSFYAELTSNLVGITPIKPNGK